MSEIYVIKRNGSKVPFSKQKLERWAKWAAENGADWEEILSEAIQRCPNGNKTTDFHQAMIDVCVDKATTESLSMAGRLVLGEIYKQAYGEYFSESGIPDFKSFYKDMIAKNYWDDWGYSDSELDAINNIIDHNKDFKYSYTTIKQIKDKYLVKDKVSSVVKESPQMMYMGMAIAVMAAEEPHRKLQEVAKYYGYLSDLKINMPTPSHNSLRTKFKGLASCVLFKTDDTADSISAGNHIVYTMTTAQAGIGGYMETRSVGDSVGNGRVVHSGKLPYYKYYESAVKSTKQASRSGSMTMYYNCLDPEIMDLLRLKGVRTPDQKRITTIDYSLSLNSFFIEQAIAGNDWMLVSYKDAPQVHEAFYSGDVENFKRVYFEVLNNDFVNKKIVSASDVVKEFLIQRQETGRIYCFFVDNANKHTPFTDKIYSSNLCAEVMLPTCGAKDVTDLYSENAKNETAICFLAAINVSQVSEDEYEDVTYYALKGVDRTMDIMDWAMPNLGEKALKRRSVGIGITNLAHYMAKNMFSYKSIDGKKEIHKLAERHSYFLHKASLRLGKELGNAEWIDKTKYPSGWLPIDTANKEIDKIVKQELLYDWETLRSEIIANGGIRNSVLEATAPYESSSQASNTTNSLYPVRDLKIIKKSGNNTNVFVVPDYDDIFVRESYELAWDVPVKDMIEVYSIVQKFHGQAISSDFYIDFSNTGKVSLKKWLAYLEYASRLGMKSWYYTNSKTKQASDIKDSGCEACKM